MPKNLPCQRAIANPANGDRGAHHNAHTQTHNERERTAAEYVASEDALTRALLVEVS